MGRLPHCMTEVGLYMAVGQQKNWQKQRMILSVLSSTFSKTIACFSIDSPSIIVEKILPNLYYTN